MTDYEFSDASNWNDVTAREDGIVDPAPPDASGDWDLFKDHRDIVTSMVIASVKRNEGDLCVLGAGACNDLDLQPLIEHFNQVVLVDTDLASMQRGMEQQGVLPDERFVRLQHGVDLAGIKEQLDVYARFPTPELMGQLKERAREHTLEVDKGKFKVVVSACTLSQLMCKVEECVASKDQDFGELLFHVRKRHIELMLDCLSPGGIGLLVTDFVSSETLPEIEKTTNLVGVLQQGLVDGNFMHGLNPRMIHATFSVPSIQEQTESLQITNPWRWPTSARVYACLGIRFQKKT